MNPSDSPWLKLRTEGAAYAKRGPRYLRKEVKAGRLRAAQIGGKRELLFRREWCDEYLESLVVPVMVPVRRRA